MAPVAHHDRHGGNLAAAARRWGRPASRFLDFSANINPLGPPPAALAAARASLSQIRHYPDPDCTALVLALARHWALPPRRILAANGSSELIAWIPAALGLRRALVVGPTFSEYARAVGAHGGAVVTALARHEDGYRPPIAEVIRRLSRRPRFDAVYLCNPNSPTGAAATPTEVRAVIRAAGRRRTQIILDESFAEYAADVSLVREAARHEHLVVLRSFTKFYGVPGLRVGYAIGAPALLDRLRERLPPWSVGTVAQAAAVAALGARAHARRSLAYVAVERRWLTDRLHRVPGVRVFPSSANFLLIDLPLNASKAADALAAHGVLIRDCSRMTGLRATTVRVAVRTHGENRRLLSALHGLLERNARG